MVASAETKSTKKAGGELKTKVAGTQKVFTY
jgi:hypothetical protein